MSDIGWMTLCIALIFGGASIVGVFDRMADQEAAKAGLQQCRIGGRILWQKECNK